MLKKVFTTLFLFVLCCPGFAQITVPAKETINNLVFPSDYKTSQLGAIPKYVKSGTGKLAMILIPGLGFDADVFKDFMAANYLKYTMYVVTIPGYGHTQAPPLPVAGTSYGEQAWNTGIIAGLTKLIEREKMLRPVILGHFVQGTQLALQMAITHPSLIGGVIIIGGPAKFIYIDHGTPKPLQLKSMIANTDNYMAPKWFKVISHEDFNAGNYLPEIYSLDTVKNKKLWQQTALVPLPVMIQYLCEFFATDITLSFVGIRCPVLVLRPGFNDKILDASINNYVRPQFIESWEKAASENPFFTIKTIPDAACFLWMDKPAEVNAEIDRFISRTSGMR